MQESTKELVIDRLSLINLINLYDQVDELKTKLDELTKK